MCERSGIFCQVPLWIGFECLYMLIYFATNHQGCSKAPNLWVLENCSESQMIKQPLFPKLWQRSDGGVPRKTRSIHLELTVSHSTLWGTYLGQGPGRLYDCSETHSQFVIEPELNLSLQFLRTGFFPVLPLAFSEVSGKIVVD